MFRFENLVPQPIVVCSLVFVALSTFTGCAGSISTSKPTEVSMKVSGKEELKKRLSSVAQTGSGGSGLAGIKEAIMELKASDAVVAEQLMVDLGQLETLEDPEQIKALAKQMSDRL